MLQQLTLDLAFDLAKINWAWPCKDLKLSDLQANGVLTQSLNTRVAGFYPH